MTEHNNDLYEQQLFVVFESCLTNGENELNEDGLFSICNKLHLDGLIEELKSCICQQHSDKGTISFSEFRDGLLLLLKKSQGIISDKQHIVQSYYNLNTMCNVDNVERNESLPLVDTISKVYPQYIKTAGLITMDESRLIRLWENIKVYLKENVDPTTMRFISSCLGIPELPKQITESMFERLDQNCDGLISFDEFVIIFQKTSIEKRGRNNESYNSVVNCNVNMLDFSASHEVSSLEISETLDKKEDASVSNAIILSSTSGDLNALDASLAELTNIICDELKNLNESLDNDTIQSHISLLREIIVIHQDEQRNLNIMIENMRTEKEKMRVDMLEANERVNTLAQEIDEYQVQLEKTKENLQRQNEQRYVEITKELSNQFNIEREMDAATLKLKDDQLQALQKENHEMKNKVVNMLQENQMLEAENKILFSQIEKLQQSNNNLLAQIKILDAEHDEIQDIETKQQEQVNFFVERIKQLQSEVTLLRDQNDELGAELENFKHYGTKDTKHEALSSLAYDLQLSEKYRDEKHVAMQESEMDRHATVQFDLEQQTDQSINCNWTTEYEKLMKYTITNDLENVLLTSTMCIPEKCALRDGISKLIIGLRSNFVPRYSAQDFGKNIASELECDMECEERTNESLRDLVVSKVPKLACAKRTVTMSNNMEDVNELSDQDVKTLTQNKITSLRDYPPRKEEHSMEQCKGSKEKDNSLNAIENVEHKDISKNVPTNAELLEIEKKQLIERCQELERSLDLLKAEYEECEDYWAAKLEEERQLFEQEQKMSDDKLAELINKIAEYEELISPSDKSKNNGRLSPIEEKFNLEQQYIDLEEEFEKWKIKAENDISQKNLEIGDLREKLKLIEHPVTSDFCIQVSDEMFSSMSSDLSHCKSPSTSSIPSTNELLANIYPHNANMNRTYHTSEFSLPSDPNGPLKQDHTDNCDTYDIHSECSVKRIKNINKNKKKQIHKKSPHISAKTMLTMKEEDKCNSEFKLIYDVMKETSYSCAHSNAQHIDYVDLNIVQDLKIRLYAQERKKRQLQRYIKQQRQYIEKLLQRIMVQHQTEVCELQCLLRNTQERLQIQVQMTVDQADKLANADILVKDLYMENTYLTAYMNHLKERCLIFMRSSGLNVGTTSM